MAIPVQNYNRATGILGGATSGRTADPGSTSPLSLLVPPAGLEWLNPSLVVSDLLGNTIAAIAGWLISHIKPIDEMLDKLCGDSGALTQHAAPLVAAAQALETHAQGMDSAVDNSRQHWTGPAADAWAGLMGAESGCARSGAPVLRAMATAVLEIGAYVGRARQAIVVAASKLIKDLMVEAGKLVGWAVLSLGGAVVEFIRWAARYISVTIRDMVTMLQSVVAEGSTHLGQVAGLGRQLERAAQVLTTGNDPGELQDVAPGSIADRTKGGHQDHDRDLAELASANNDAGDAGTGMGSTAVPPPYEQVTDPQALADLGITPDMLHDETSGFNARVFTDPKTGEVVVAFNGTNFGEGNDVGEDVTGTTVLSPQSEQAMRLAQAINSSAQADNVVYTGHSLGGRLAAVASMTSGNPAVTFNSAGVSSATQNYFAALNGSDPQAYREQINAGQVRSYTTGNDPLTMVQERVPGVNDAAPDSVGLRIHLGPTDNVGAITDAAGGHGMDNVLKH